MSSPAVNPLISVNETADCAACNALYIWKDALWVMALVSVSQFHPCTFLQKDVIGQYMLRLLPHYKQTNKLLR